MIIWYTSIVKKTFLIKSGPIFDKAAKLGKASWDAYNWGGWLILKEILKNWVAQGVASGVNNKFGQQL